MSYDNACKYLAEQYPAEFARWLLSAEADNIQVLKTELSAEPIRADSLSFLQIANQILHLEFQTQPTSNPPLPLRMLDYWVRLYRQYRCHIEQVVIFLQPTTSEVAFTNQFSAPNTTHRYRVIRLWEQDPAPLLASPALLPLATLAQSDSPRTLLEQVAAQVARIDSAQERTNLSACVEILAGLRFNSNLIHQLFREEIMQESVIYQEILQKGEQQGLQRGRQEGELNLLLRQLNRRLGGLTSQLEEQIRLLSIPQLEELGEALLNFSADTDLISWLEAHSCYSIREEMLPDSITYQEILQQRLQQGRQEGELALLLRLLTLRIGTLTPQLEAQIRGLAIPQLEALGEALLDFSSEADLISWLEALEQSN